MTQYVLKRKGNAPDSGCRDAFYVKGDVSNLADCKLTTDPKDALILHSRIHISDYEKWGWEYVLYEETAPVKPVEKEIKELHRRVENLAGMVGGLQDEVSQLKNQSATTQYTPSRDGVPWGGTEERLLLMKFDMFCKIRGRAQDRSPLAIACRLRKLMESKEIKTWG